MVHPQVVLRSSNVLFYLCCLCKTQFVGFGLKAKGRCLGHSQCLFLKQGKSAILLNTNNVCLFICHSKTLPCKAVGMLLGILFLSCVSVFVMEFLCSTNAFLMYLCSCPCSNSLQNTWQASRSSYVWSCLVKEASFLLPCDEQRGKRSLCPRGFTIKTLLFYGKT